MTKLKNLVAPWELTLGFIPEKPLTTCQYKTGFRPRRMSIHAIAAMSGQDPFDILKEMEEAGPFEKDLQGHMGNTGRILGYRCPDVDCTVIYLKAYRKIMIDTPRPDWIQTAKYDLKKYPYPKTKGFTAFPAAYLGETYNCAEPFKPADKPYQDELAAYLKTAIGKVTREEFDAKVASYMKKAA